MEHEESETSFDEILAPVDHKRRVVVIGLRPFPKRGGVVTNELIDKLREDDAY